MTPLQAPPHPATRDIRPPPPQGSPGPFPAGVEPPDAARRRPRLRLPTLLAGLVAAVLLPMLLLGGAAVWQAVEGRQAAARGGLRDTARALSLAVDREIGAYHSAVATLATSGALDGPEPDLRRFEVDARRAAAALGTSIVLLEAATMRQAVNTALPPGAPAGAVSAGDFRAVAETGLPLVTDLVVGTVARRPVVGVAVPVERDGRVPFVLAARLAPERLHRLLAAQGLSGAGFAAVTDAKNVVVARSDTLHEELVGRPIPPENARRIEGRGAGLYRAVALNGVEHVFGFHKLDAAPGWTVFVAAPAAAFDAAWRWPLLGLAAGGVLALASGGALALVAARGVLAPVRRLTEHARALAEGGDAAVPPPASAAAIPPAPVAELEALRRGFAGAEAAIAHREAALAEAETARRELLATLDLGAAMARDLDGTIRHWSKGCERLYGWTAEEAVGRASHDLLGTAFPGPPAEVEAALEREGEWTGELRQVARDGREIVVLARKVLRRDAAGRPAAVLESFADVTAQRRAETELAANAARLGAVLDNVPVGVLLAEAPSGRIIMGNRRVEEILRHPVLPSPGVEAYREWEGYHPDGRRLDARDYPMVRALAGERAPAMEMRYRRGDGTFAWIAVSAAPICDPETAAMRGAVAAVADIDAERGAREALAQSEERLREQAERVDLALAAGAIIGTWNWDLPADRFTVDERFAQAFGIDPALGRSGLSLEQVIAAVHPDDLAGLRRAIASAIARGGPYSHEYRVRGRDGVYRWIEANGRVDHGPGGTPLRFPGVLLDVERRRTAEAERDRAAALLRAFVEAVPGVVYAKDREGRMLIANEGTAALIGKPPEEFIGRTDKEFLDDAAQAEAVMANDRWIMESGVAEQVEEAVGLPDGTPAVWLSTKAPFRNAAGEVIGLIGSSVDITGRKRAEERLRESEARLRLAGEAGGVGFFSCDLATGATHWSETMFRLYGLEPTGPAPSMDYGGRHLEAVHPDDRESLSAARAALAADRTRGGFAFEFRIRRADTGETRWIASRGEVERDDAGRIVLVRGAQQDVTHRREAEDRLRLMVNELNHRVKNTLATVLSIASQTLRGTDPAVREAFEDRLLALAAAHDVLTREGWAGADIDEVVAGVLAPHGGRGDGRFRVSGKRLRLAPRAAVALSMGLHELATNALKYGALSVPGGGAGCVEIRWDVVPGGDAGPRFRLAWTERDGPPVSPPARRGFGTRLVERSLARDLDGTAALDFAPDGLACVIEAPLAGLAAPAAAPPLPRVGGTGAFGA